MPLVNNIDDEWECEVQCNRALLELRRHGGGPVHINLITSYRFSENTALTCKELPPVRVINRYFLNDELPEMPNGKVAIFVGSHNVWPPELVKKVESFCATNNAVVLADHPSNYNGKYKIPYALVINQSSINKANKPAFDVDLLVHIGGVTGEEGAVRMIHSKDTWRVSPDGEIRDTFKNLSAVFEMNEEDFFTNYSSTNNNVDNYYRECKNVYDGLVAKRKEIQDEMPLSNPWIAGEIAGKIPQHSSVVLAILNTLRTWNYAEFNSSVDVYCPLGGFGIDGATSLALGVALADKDKLCYCITGDLAFFYDLNSLGNRNLCSNLRILLVNNGCGVEFKKTYAMAYRLLGDEVDEYVAAARHNGNKSNNLIKDFSRNLGFEYLSASSKDEFEKVYKRFVTPEITDAPMLFEVFVDADDECKALNIVHDR
jgi:2-succinyl-5-enolpyruvyl-6-hydroxy-3-cyclohexene-1-carboxylate synthase